MTVSLNSGCPVDLPEEVSAEWYRAVTLVERLPVTNLTPVTATPAQKGKLQEWQTQNPFIEAHYWNARLNLDGLTQVDLLHLIGEPAQALRERLVTPPEWLQQLITRLTSPAADDALDRLIGEVDEGGGAGGILQLLKPLIRPAIERLADGVNRLAAQYPAAFNRSEILKILLENLIPLLTWRLNLVLALELNIARIKGRLQGASPQERYAFFLANLSLPGHLAAFLEEYPVLARQLMQVAEFWADFGLEFMGNLCKDRQLITSTFHKGAEPGHLVKIKGEAGDLHRRGRSVLLLEFSSGLRLVYKPKSMSLDRHFQDLLAWLNTRATGQFLPFRVLCVLDRGNYGWTEFVNMDECRERGEISRFYTRQGGYLALLYALEAIDFHFENLIAAGEHPVLVDLEALFHPRIERQDKTITEDPALNNMVFSVLRIGLLPERLGSSPGSPGVDLSGLGGQAGQLSSQKLAVWQGAGTDEMRLVKERLLMEGAHNRPRLNGDEVNVMDYLEDFTAGFEKIYRVLTTYRAELIAGPLTAFSRNEMRIVMRPTQVYSNLLRKSFHPDFLRNALDRDRHFDHLWAKVKLQPALERLIQAERADLLNGDIPMFTGRIDSCDIYGSQGQVVADYLAESSLELVTRRLADLSEQDLKVQIWLIRASFATIPIGYSGTSWKESRLVRNAAPATVERLLAAANSIGERLAEMAVREKGAVNWMGLSPVSEREWQLAPAGFDLYSGTAGISFYLAYLGHLTGQPQYTELAYTALETMRRTLQQYLKGENQPMVGAFQGLGSAIYLFTHLAQLWDEPALLDEAEKIIIDLPAYIAKDDIFDVIAGSAGCLNSLLSLYENRPNPLTLGAAIACGDHLLQKATPVENGIGWLNIASPQRPLAGFSHGAAGIALSLLRLHHLTGDIRYQEGAMAAITYERSLFNPAVGNWADARTLDVSVEEGGTLYPTQWCHGAAGIGLARLGCLELVQNPDMEQEVKVAIETTLREGFGLNHCLCHGDLGNLELLVVAGMQNQLAAQEYTAMILDSIEQQGCITGLPLGIESPGLMTGLAGIGYGLLRAAFPGKLPSVLLLEPPPLSVK